MSSSILSLIVGVGLAGYGLWITFAEVSRFHRTQTWPKVSGRIILSQVEENSDSESTSYSARVEYEYSILGLRYRGVENLIDIASGFRKSAEALCEAYPAGRSLLIAYNPQRIEQSEIADEAQCKLRFSTIIGAVFFIAFGLAMLFGR